MIRRALTALTLTALAIVGAPVAHADCQFPVVVIAIAGPVTLICGDGDSSTTNHVTTVTIQPSLQVDPHLFAPAPPPQ